MGKTVMSVSSWERGKRTPEPDNLVKLAAALGIPPDDLIDMPRSEWGIAEFRMVMGLTQAGVAEETGVLTSRMSHIEMTYEEPDEKLYAALTKLYRVSPGEIEAAWKRSRERYTTETP